MSPSSLPASGQAGASPPAVELLSVSRHFGAVVAVDHIDLTIGNGEFFSLLGPSGCGKTTTLRLIAGFETPTDGRILILGQEVQHLPAYRRNVNTAFQNYALFPHLNVFENIAFGLRRRGVGRAEIADKVKWSLGLVRLAGFEKRRTTQLSGGEQQRVAMARALVNTPAVLLLDEPLSALDEKLRKQMQLELKRIQREIGVTFVLVTHDQEEALTLSDRIAVMNGGRVEQVGTPTEIYERPTTRFVTEFVGASNFFRGHVVGRDGDMLAVRVSDAGETVRVPGTVEGDVEFFVRPEKMWIGAGAESRLPSEGEGTGGTDLAAANRLRAVLRTVIYQGPATRFEVEVAGRIMSVSVMNLAPPPDLGAGSEVWVHWQPSSGRLLGKPSGAA